MFKYTQLKKIYIENFQAIEEYQEIDISPITILAGPNSAGKSAILDFLEGFSELCSGHEQSFFDYRKNLRFNAEQSTIGIQCLFDPSLLEYYRLPRGIPSDQLFFKKTGKQIPEFKNIAKEKYYIDIIFKIKWPFSEIHNKKKQTGSPFFSSINLSINNKPILALKNEQFQIYIDNYPFFTKDKLSEFVINQIDRPIWKYSSESVDLSINKLFKQAKKDSFFDLFFYIGESIVELLDLSSINQVTASRSIPKKEELLFVGYEFEGGSPSKYMNISHDDLEKLMPALVKPKKNRYDSDRFDLNLNLYYQLATSLAAKKYIDASENWVKSQPKFHCPTCNIENYTIRAEGYEKVKKDHLDLKDNKDRKIEYCPFCGDYLIKDENRLDELYGMEDQANDLNIIEKVNELLLNDFMADKSYQIDGDVDFIVSDKNVYPSDTYSAKTVCPIIQLYLIDANNNKLNFDDIGSGMAYCLPVLIASCQNDSIQFVQQPELHIHPSLQSRFAKVFVDKFNQHQTRNHLGSKPNLQYIIETHSEHMILSFLKIIRDKHHQKIDCHFSADDISVLYFEPNLIKQNTKVKKIRITQDGDFLDKWPAGFFNDREILLFDIYE